MQFVRSKRPTANAVTVADVKANERIRHGFEDDQILRSIRAAEGHIEKRTNRAIMRQTFELTVDRLSPSLKLFYPPMEGSVKITKARSEVRGQVVDYDVELLKLRVADQLPVVSFASIARAALGEMVIEYETGAATPDEVPAEIQQAVLLLASYFYKNREAAVSDSRITTTERAIPFGVNTLIEPFWIRNVNTPYFEERIR